MLPTQTLKSLAIQDCSTAKLEAYANGKGLLQLLAWAYRHADGEERATRRRGMLRQPA